MPNTAGRPLRRNGPSIDDVARLAGVSSQTVSRVSTGSQPVRPETRARVIAAMGQLGYSPNHAARALRGGAFKTIGLLISQLERTGEALIMSAVIAAAEAESYAVTVVNVHNTDPDDWENAAGRLTHQTIDGLIIIRAETDTPESLALPVGMPIAVSDSRLVAYYPAVRSDQVEGSQKAIQHLLGLGHRTVHHLAGPTDSDSAHLRAATWQRCLEQSGIHPPQLWRGDWSAQAGYQLGLDKARDPEVTAIFCANDEMAFGLLRALHEIGRRVPEDISVVGFDGIGLSEFSLPALTTVRQDFQTVGSELVGLIMKQLRSKNCRLHQSVVVSTELVVRATTAPPGSRALTQG